ncbi:Rv0804 family intramembrane glutamic endopeptidase [Mycobacterium sp. URHB0021]|jgi:CAAX protease family protein
MRAGKFRALATAAALVGWSFAAPRVRFHPVLNAALGTGLAALTRPPLGLRPPALTSGLRNGVPAAAAIALVGAVITAVPQVRADMVRRKRSDHPVRWLLLDIPLGTVWPEEVAFRAMLGGMAQEAFGPVGARWLQSVTFGLWHIVDARLTGHPVLGTVFATAVTGWSLGWLHDRSGSLAAPMLAHLAINEVGAVATLVVQGRR